jgi:hypothetical protein
MSQQFSKALKTFKEVEGVCYHHQHTSNDCDLRNSCESDTVTLILEGTSSKIPLVIARFDLELLLSDLK